MICPTKSTIGPHHVTLVAGLVCLALSGCHNRGHDSGGGDGPGSSLLLENGDLTRLADHLQLLSGSVTATLALLPGVEAGSDGTPGDPCWQSDEVVDGDHYQVWVSWAGCTVAVPAHGQAVLEGEATIEGPVRPGDDDVEEVLSRVRVHDPAIDTRLFDAGQVQGLGTRQGSFELRTLEGARLMNVLEDTTTLLSYERDLVIEGHSVVPFQAEGERRFDLDVTVLFDLGMPPATTANLHRPGEKSTASLSGLAWIDLVDIQEIAPDGMGGPRVVETVRFELDGSPLARFELEQAGRSGSLDLESGQVTFD